MRPSEERPLDRSKSSVADLQARGLLDPFSVVGTDTEFEELVRAVRAQPQVRTVAVTDDDGRLTGIIPMRAFYGALMADVYPGVVMADVVSFESALQLRGPHGPPNGRTSSCWTPNQLSLIGHAARRLYCPASLRPSGPAGGGRGRATGWLPGLAGNFAPVGAAGVARPGRQALRD